MTALCAHQIPAISFKQPNECSNLHDTNLPKSGFFIRQPNGKGLSRVTTPPPLPLIGQLSYNSHLRLGPTKTIGPQQATIAASLALSAITLRILVHSPDSSFQRAFASAI